MTKELADKLKAATARIAARAAELMVEFPNASVNECTAAAEFEERLINGAPGAPMPKGILSL